MSNISLDISERIAIITLNRPEKLNAFTPQMLEDLAAVFASTAKDDAISCLVIHGAGKCFSVGASLAGAAPGTSPETHDCADDANRLHDTLDLWMKAWRHPKPVVAQVHGYCMGVATLLAICCDVTYVAEDAVIGWPTLPLGAGLLGPASAWLIGPKRAKELSFVVGSQMSGIEAAEWGWANRAIPADRLENATRRFAERVSRTPSDLLAIKKRAINRVIDTQGFAECFAMGAEFDAVAHGSRGVKTTREMIAELGLKGAIHRFQHGGDA